MNPEQIRQLWRYIESCDARTLLRLERQQLGSWIVSQFQRSYPLSPAAAGVVQDYVDARQALIRDLAGDRLLNS